MTNFQGLLSHVHMLIFSKSNLKLQVFGLFLRFVRTLITKVSSFEESANNVSIHRVRNDDKLGIFFHPSSKIIRKRWRSPRNTSLLNQSQWNVILPMTLTSQSLDRNDTIHFGRNCNVRQKKILQWCCFDAWK